MSFHEHVGEGTESCEEVKKKLLCPLGAVLALRPGVVRQFDQRVAGAGHLVLTLAEGAKLDMEADLTIEALAAVEFSAAGISLALGQVTLVDVGALTHDPVSVGAVDGGGSNDGEGWVAHARILTGFPSLSMK
jgi:hypothetical protein